MNRYCFAAWLAGLVLFTMTTRASCQKRHDPLNQLEIDQLRDSAQDPDTRLHLYIKFAQQRLTAVEQARTDPKNTDRTQTMHDQLQDFVDLYDELNDNIDTYADQRQDIRHVLKAVIEADAEFKTRLHALKEAGAPEDELHEFAFVLSDAVDDVEGSVKDHTDLLAEQEEAAKHKRLIKPQPPSRGKPPQ